MTTGMLGGAGGQSPRSGGESAGVTETARTEPQKEQGMGGLDFLNFLEYKIAILIFKKWPQEIEQTLPENRTWIHSRELLLSFVCSRAGGSQGAPLWKHPQPLTAGSQALGQCFGLGTSHPLILAIPLIPILPILPLIPVIPIISVIPVSHLRHP